MSSPCSWITPSGPPLLKEGQPLGLQIQRHCPRCPSNVVETCQPRQAKGLSANWLYAQALAKAIILLKCVKNWPNIFSHTFTWSTFSHKVTQTTELKVVF